MDRHLRSRASILFWMRLLVSRLLRNHGLRIGLSLPLAVSEIRPLRIKTGHHPQSAT